MNTRNNKLTKVDANFNQNKWMIENTRAKFEVLPPLNKNQEHPIYKCANCKCNIDTEWCEAFPYFNGHLCEDCEEENARDSQEMFKDTNSDYQGGLV